MNFRVVFSLLLSLFILQKTVITSQAQSQYPKDYQIEIMNAVNSKRMEVGLNAVEVDPKLCELAEIVSLDSELAYPEKITGTWKSNTKYKDYLKDYNIYFNNSISMLDMLASMLKANGETVAYEKEQLIDMYTDFESGGIESVPANPNITHACAGASDGTHGYKGFAYFIGGIKNEPESWFSSFWNNILAIFGN